MDYIGSALLQIVVPVGKKIETKDVYLDILKWKNGMYGFSIQW